MTVYQLIVAGVYLSRLVTAYSNVDKAHPVLLISSHKQPNRTDLRSDPFVLSRRNASPTQEKDRLLPSRSAPKASSVRPSRTAQGVSVSSVSPAAKAEGTKRKSRDADSVAISSDPKTRDKRQRGRGPAAQIPEADEVSSRPPGSTVRKKQRSPSPQAAQAQGLGEFLRQNHPTLGKRPLEGGMSPISELKGRPEFFVAGPSDPATQTSNQLAETPNRLPFSHPRPGFLPNRRVSAHATLDGPGIMRAYGTQQGTRIIHAPPGRRVSTSIHDLWQVAVQAELHESKEFPSTERGMKVETTGANHLHSAQPGFFPRLNRKTAHVGGPITLSILPNIPGGLHQQEFSALPGGTFFDTGIEHRGATGSIMSVTGSRPIDGPDQSKQEGNPPDPQSALSSMPTTPKMSLEDLVRQQAQSRPQRPPNDGAVSRHDLAQQARLNALPPGIRLSPPQSPAGDLSNNPAGPVAQSPSQGT